MGFRGRIFLAAALGVSAAVAQSLPAQSFTLFGKTFFEKEPEEIIGEPQPYELSFDYSGD